MSSGDEKYGGWCVNWTAYDVPTLWRMLQNEGSIEAYQQAATWVNTHDLLGYHMGELRKCRDELAARWPPTRSPAAGMFIDYVDNLLGSMRQMMQDAAANGDALRGVNQALVKARNDISTLHDQWQKYQRKEDNPPTILGLVGLSPDVPDDWRKHLTEQAAKHMVAADKTVFEHTSKMAVPVPYTALNRDSGFTSIDDRNSGSDGDSGVRTGRAVGGDWSAPPHIPPPPLAEPPSQATGGPVLSGSAGTGGTVIAPPPAPAPTTPNPPGGFMPTVIGPAGPFRPGPSPSDGRATTTRPETRTGGASRVAPGESTAARGHPAVAPGGAIGGVGGRTPAGARTVATDGPRANPVGGVIGGGQAGGVGQAGGGAAIRGGPNRRRHPGIGQKGDHFDPWAVAEGGLSVLEPDTTPQRHEPGPGVIGIDR